MCASYNDTKETHFTQIVTLSLVPYFLWECNTFALQQFCSVLVLQTVQHTKGLTMIEVRT